MDNNSDNMQIISQPPSIRIAAELQIGDLSDVAVSRWEDQLRIDLANTDKELKKLAKEQDDLSIQLRELAHALCMVEVRNEFGTLEAALRSIKDEHTVDDKRKPAVFAEVGLVDSENKTISYKAGVAGKIMGKIGYERATTFSSDVMACTLELKEVCDKQIETNAARVNTVEQLADLPRLARRAKTALLEKHLRGELQNNVDILQILQDTKPLALPSR